MRKPKQTATIDLSNLPPDDDTPPSDIDEQEVTPEAVELDRVLNEMQNPESAVVEVYRQISHSRDLRYIDQMPVANYTIAALKSPPYNGGNLRVIVRNQRGHIVVNKLVPVEPPTAAPPPINGAQAAPHSTDTAAIMTAVLQVMGTGFNKLGELIVAAAKENKPEVRTTKDILDELAAYKNLFTPETSQNSPIDPMEQLDKILGVAEKLRGFAGEGGSPTTPFGEILAAAKFIIPEIRQSIQAAQHAPPVVDDEQPAGALPQPPKQPAKEKANMNPNAGTAKKMSDGIDFLVTQAAKDNDPSTYAGLLVDQVPHEILREYVDSPSWFEQICMLNAGARPYREWFDELKGIVIGMLTDEQNAEQTVTPNDAATPGSDNLSGGSAAGG